MTFYSINDTRTCIMIKWMQRCSLHLTEVLAIDADGCLNHAYTRSFPVVFLCALFWSSHNMNFRNSAISPFLVETKKFLAGKRTCLRLEIRCEPLYHFIVFLL